MAHESTRPPNWFDRGGGDYARFRPDYPSELPGVLAATTSSHAVAVDVGCGSGQLSAHLVPHFASVIGLDPSLDQIRHAAADAGVRYVCARSERIPLVDRSTDLITAAQSAHWFDLPAFYAEARRIAAPGAVIALISYGVPQLDPHVGPRFERFNRQEMGRYWPPERRLVESGYADLDFPFPEVRMPVMRIRRDLDLGMLLGYISTWSAVRRAVDADRTDLLERFARDLTEAWGEPDTARPVIWPVNLRVGTV